jgi:predicted MFS family arabinose efflux permease
MINKATLTACGGMIAMAVGIGIGRFVYTPILPPMLAALGLSKATAGLIASANFLGYLAGALAAARLSLPGSKRWWLLGALAASALTTGAMGLVADVPWFLALRFLGGVASALVLIFASALVMDRLAADGKPGLSALHFAGVGAGIAVSAVLVSSVSGWDAMWRASGLASIIGLVLAGIILPQQTDQPPASRQTAAAHRDPALRRMTIAYGLFGFGYVITATFLVAIVRTEVPRLESSIWIMVGLGAAPSIWLWNRLARRIGTAPAFAVASLCEATGVLASVASAGVLSVSLGAILLGGTFMGLTALGLSRARELAHGDVRRAMAAMTGAFGVGQIVGPLVAGVLSDALGGFLVPSALAAGALLVAGCLAIAPVRTETRTATRS